MSYFSAAVDATDAAFLGGIAQNKSPEDNRAALQTALDTQKHVFVPPGSFRLAPGLVATIDGQHLYGAAPSQSRLVCIGEGTFFNTNAFSGVKVASLRYQGKTAQGIVATGGYGVWVDGIRTFGGIPQQSARCGVEDVEFHNMPNGIYVRDHNSFYANNVFLSGMRGLGIRAEALTTNHRIDILSLTRIAYSGETEARNAGLCEALSVDGDVQTIILNEFRAVKSTYGIALRNTAGLPYGQHAAFLLGRGVEIDFPLYDGVQITHCDRVRFTDLYCHGSEAGNGILALSGTRDLKILGGNVTGHNGNGIVFDGNKMDVIGVEFEWNGQRQAGAYNHIALLGNARNVSVLGGGVDASCAFGVARSSGYTNAIVQGVCGSGSVGLTNF